MKTWDRSQFAMDPSELLVEEAVRAMMRVLEETQVDAHTRRSLVRAVHLLKSTRV